MRTLLAFVLLALGPAIAAAEGLNKPTRGLGAVGMNVNERHLPSTSLKARAGGPDYAVSFSAKSGALAETGRFVVSEGSQANYVVGGEEPWAASSGVEYKKKALVLNLVVRKGAGDALTCELQMELSGPQPPQPDAKVQSPATTTAQIQTTFHARLGKPVVLLDQGGRRLELTIEPAP